MQLRWRAPLTLALLFSVAAGLMIGAMRQESATVDETVFVGAGWSYWLGHRYRLLPEHPPLMQLLAALPLKMLDVRTSALGDAILSSRLLADPATRWDLGVADAPLHTAELFPQGPGFYHYPFDEQSLFGGDFIYSGRNDAERLMFWSRVPEVLLTLLTALMAWQWARGAQGETAGLLAASMFLLNPVVLAYGHIVQSDIGMALAFPLAVWIFARLLETPSGRKAVLAGAAVGLALATKHTAIILAPTFAVLWLLHRRRRKTDWKSILIVPAVAWGMILLLYAPHWSPPPLIDAATAAKLAVPWWLTALRPILIPGEYFKGLALTALHASTGHEAYLNGAWSHSGWWYYFPLAFAMKTPLPFLFFAGAGIAMAVRSRHRIGFVELAAWTGALIYLLCAMPSKTNIGVRHILAVYPLLAIGAACSLSRCINGLQQRRQQFAGLALSVLLAANLGCTLLAYPYFICYLNLLAGGTEHGYEHLLDSNYDWGQDVIRLRKFVDARNISKIYLQYFGTQAAIDYYKIPCEFVDSHAARQIREGYLVISAQALMLPEWEWLRGSRQPSARVGYTLFVYEINPSPRPL